MPPTPARRLDQNLLTVDCPQIIVSVIWEDELTPEVFAGLFEDAKTNPRHIGLSAGYTPAGRLTILAFALGSKVYLIRFRNDRENKTMPPGRQLLQDELLCSANNLLYAFDMGPIALSLYIDRRLRISGAVDVQTACYKDEPDRDVANAVEFAVNMEKNVRIIRTNINTTFKNQVWEERDPKTSIWLAFRAWLAGFLPSSVSDMELRFAEVSRIDTLEMADEVCNVMVDWLSPESLMSCLV